MGDLCRSFFQGRGNETAAEALSILNLHFPSIRFGQGRWHDVDGGWRDHPWPKRQARCVYRVAEWPEIAANRACEPPIRRFGHQRRPCAPPGAHELRYSVAESGRIDRPSGQCRLDRRTCSSVLLLLGSDQLIELGIPHGTDGIRASAEYLASRRIGIRLTTASCERTHRERQFAHWVR